ncbi:MAG TPA: GNAT family N-acetyltransferase [bacterium]|nr:GNAT family N-acetyltransferase [bacterium]
MKIIFSEHQFDYTTYTFPYCVYCLKEAQNEIAAIYEKGFLPYTGNLNINRDLFYLARSVRVNLAQFKDSSENRRVDRIVQELSIDVYPVQKSNFDFDASDFIEFCYKFAESRFSGGTMGQERIRYIFQGNVSSHIFMFQTLDKVYGYVFAAIHGNMLHYWYAFFDVSYLRTHSLGKWMMWRMIKWAKENRLDYVYLGTCYKTGALYKVRDHSGVEFFDGIGWNDDIDLLKYWCKNDETFQAKNIDRLKSADPEFSKIFWQLINQFPQSKK